ncbi:MAG: alkaline phosphatase [Alphaproteobacteria bacterium]|nr:alkaline phosphatase [Alphaproteobacteria bacterium]
MAELDNQTRTELEAAAFRTLVQHLRDNTDIQNIDLMNLANFCRNCLSKWYKAAADAKGVDLDYEGARELIYGMPYAEWKEKYQTAATSEKLTKMKEKADH